MSNYWTEQKVQKEELLFTLVKNKLSHNYMKDCMHVIGTSEEGSKLCTYKLFKDKDNLEPYLCNVIDQRYWIALSCFRLSSHNLDIETGRYTRQKTPVINIICKYCDTGDTEDEIHFLMNCPMHRRERLKLQNTVQQHYPGIHTLSQKNQFKVIMKCTTVSIMIELGKFLFLGFQNSIK